MLRDRQTRQSARLCVDNSRAFFISGSNVFQLLCVGVCLCFMGGHAVCQDSDPFWRTEAKGGWCLCHAHCDAMIGRSIGAGR